MENNLKPLIQGGMGIGVSMGNLAGNVAKNGAMGVISCANTGFYKDYFWENPLKANLDAIKEQIAKAKKIAKGNGLIGINVMVAGNYFGEIIQTAVEEGIDFIISGAGLPLNLPEYVKNTKVLIAPIVSSAKAFKTISKVWDKKYQKTPDFVVIEGALAGGHLGFSKKELAENTANTLENILADVIESKRDFEEKYNKKIKIYVAGAVNTREKVKAMLKLGADGVQVATRFITTKECDATQAFKDVYIKAKNEDIAFVQSPVGLDGRAIYSKLFQKLDKNGRIAPEKCMNCIKVCNPSNTPYCITNALIQGYYGNEEDGLFFTDADVSMLDKMTTVKEVIDELMGGE